MAERKRRTEHYSYRAQGYIPPQSITEPSTSAVTDNKKTTENDTNVEFICQSRFWGQDKQYEYHDVWLYSPDDKIFNIENLVVGATVNIHADRSNEYDHRAVAAKINGKIIGYLYKKDRRYSMANEWIDAGLPMLGLVESIKDNKISITMAFYGKPNIDKMESEEEITDEDWDNLYTGLDNSHKPPQENREGIEKIKKKKAEDAAKIITFVVVIIIIAILYVLISSIFD